MAGIEDVDFGALSFSDGVFEGVATVEYGAAVEDAPPAAVDPDDDVAPTEHHDITDTPVTQPAPTSKKRNTALKSQLEGIYGMAGAVLFPIDPQTATVILSQAPQCAEALDDLARKDPKVKAALESLLSTSAWGAVIAAHLPILVQVGTKYVPELRDRYKRTVADRDPAAA